MKVGCMTFYSSLDLRSLSAHYRFGKYVAIRHPFKSLQSRFSRAFCIAKNYLLRPDATSKRRFLMSWEWEEDVILWIKSAVYQLPARLERESDSQEVVVQLTWMHEVASVSERCQQPLWERGSTEMCLFWQQIWEGPIQPDLFRGKVISLGRSALFVWSKVMSDKLLIHCRARLFAPGLSPQHNALWWESTLTRLTWPHISTCVHKVSSMSRLLTSLDRSVKPLKQGWKSCFGKHSSRNHPDQNVARHLLPELICG